MAQIDFSEELSRIVAQIEQQAGTKFYFNVLGEMLNGANSLPLFTARRSQWKKRAVISNGDELLSLDQTIPYM